MFGPCLLICHFRVGINIHKQYWPVASRTVFLHDLCQCCSHFTKNMLIFFLVAGTVRFASDTLALSRGDFSSPRDRLDPSSRGGCWETSCAGNRSFGGSILFLASCVVVVPVFFLSSLDCVCWWFTQRLLFFFFFSNSLFIY